MDNPIRFLTVNTQHYDQRFNWKGYHNYDLGKPGVTSVSDHANDVISWASAFHGEHTTVSNLGDISRFEQFDVVLFIGQDYFHTVLKLIPQIKKRFPKTIVLGMSETPLRMHKAYCRLSWDYQKTFYEFSNLVDIMLTWHNQGVEYYGLFRDRDPDVVYFPHPYPFEFVSLIGKPLEPGDRLKILYKAGSMHGRPGTDGFADIVPVIRAQRRYPEYKIQIYEHASHFRELMKRAEQRPHEFWIERLYRGVEQKLFGSGNNRLRQSIVNRLQKLFYRRLSFPEPLAPLKMRGVDRNDILSHARMPWRDILPLWRTVYLGLDLDQTYTQGRNIKDAATFGTPMIGVNSDFQTFLYPDLKVDEMDYRKAEELIVRLITDHEFYNDIGQHAYKQIQRVGYDISQRRFIQFIKDYRAGKKSWGIEELINYGG